ncbi:DUF1405 domain-containing protein [Bacillus hwajinpoensis]|uniref:DUF1405 domain-containing protein n=1 Tax=Guptibacillus hwajinpoensis TaxID=208199 RepID=A0A845EXT3_9BACL|nr:DUF1405 domain-containing protein [Pseudalkalibacillus hwajinpoensis]MYL63392.1 DUF1405 domain-containing protein [Pseudalkalibacillus hwajinpoensis]
MVSHLFYLLKSKPFLVLLLLINIPGTIYGYYWYGWQLADTEPIFLLFVPDSPTASLFFCFVLLAFLFKKNWPLMEGLAAVTLFKYGIWAVVMNALVMIETNQLSPIAIMLILSHLGMAIEGLLFTPFYKIKRWHLVAVAIWTLHNDVIDYVFGQMPRYSILSEYTSLIGYFTFWLSLVSLTIVYFLAVRKERFKLSIQ